MTWAIFSEAFGDLQPVHVGVDRGKGAEDLAHVQAHLERMVALRIEGVGAAIPPANKSGCRSRPWPRMLDRLLAQACSWVARAAAEATPNCLMKSLRMMDSGRFMVLSV